MDKCVSYGPYDFFHPRLNFATFQKDKVHEGPKSDLFRKLMKFGYIVCVCLRRLKLILFKVGVLFTHLWWRHTHKIPHATYVMVYDIKNDAVYHCFAYTVLSLFNEVYLYLYYPCFWANAVLQKHATKANCNIPSGLLQTWVSTCFAHAPSSCSSGKPRGTLKLFFCPIH